MTLITRLSSKGCQCKLYLMECFRSHRIKSIDMYNEINDILGVVEEVLENITYNIDDSLSKDYIGKYKLVDGEMGTNFPKHLIKDSILEIGVKDRILYVMIDEKYLIPLYYFKRINQNRYISNQEKPCVYFI